MLFVSANRLYRFSAWTESHGCIKLLDIIIQSGHLSNTEVRKYCIHRVGATSNDVPLQCSNSAKGVKRLKLTLRCVYVSKLPEAYIYVAGSKVVVQAWMISVSAILLYSIFDESSFL